MTVRVLAGEHGGEIFEGEELGEETKHMWNLKNYNSDYFKFLRKIDQKGYNFITTDGVLMYINPSFVVFVEEIVPDEE